VGIFAKLEAAFYILNCSESTKNWNKNFIACFITAMTGILRVHNL